MPSPGASSDSPLGTEITESQPPGSTHAAPCHPMLQRRLPRASRNWNPSLQVAVAPGSYSKFLFLFRFFRVQLSRSRPGSIFQHGVGVYFCPRRASFVEDGESAPLIPKIGTYSHQPMPQFLKGSNPLNPLNLFLINLYFLNSRNNPLPLRRNTRFFFLWPPRRAPRRAAQFSTLASRLSPCGTAL